MKYYTVINSGIIGKLQNFGCVYIFFLYILFIFL